MGVPISLMDDVVSALHQGVQISEAVVDAIWIDTDEAKKPSHLFGIVVRGSVEVGVDRFSYQLGYALVAVLREGPEKELLWPALQTDQGYSIERFAPCCR